MVVYLIMGVSQLSRVENAVFAHGFYAHACEILSIAIQFVKTFRIIPGSQEALRVTQ